MTVCVVHLRVTSRLTGLDDRGLRIVERAIPSTGRERGDVPGEIVVGSNRAAAAIAALERRGYRVETTHAAQPAGGAS